MDIFVYSDESGVFDYLHNDWFVFGGLVLLGKAEKDNASRLYIKAEKDIRNNSLKHFEFCNSTSKTLIRAADIVANRIFYCTSSNIQISQNKTGPFITRFP